MNDLQKRYLDETAEAGRMQIEVLPVFRHRVADALPALVECPAHLLKQPAALCLECSQVRIVCSRGIIPPALDAQVHHSICHTLHYIICCIHEDTVTKDRQDLYLHPASFSGVLDEANIPLLREQLSGAQTFQCYAADCYEEYLDLSDEEYWNVLICCIHEEGAGASASGSSITACSLSADIHASVTCFAA